MAKTVTVRVDDTAYELIKRAADGQRRTISNYIEYATLNYTISESLVDDGEMEEILERSKEIEKGLSDVAAGRYTLVERI